MLQRILYNICNSLKNIVQKVKDIMGEYSKKLHIRKNGTIEDITLYTNSDVSNNTIKVRDGSTICYVPIGATDDSNASSLRVRKNGTTYAVLKQNYPTGSVTYTTNVLPEKPAKKNGQHNHQSKTYQLSLPAGTKKIQVLCYADGYGGNTKTVDVSGVSNIYIVVSRNDERIDGADYYCTYVTVYKNSTDDKNNVIGKTDNDDGQCRATISWSPAINNS